MSLYRYGNDFFAYQQIGSLASARAVVPLVLRYLKPTRILDVGCGAGAWLSAYLECGAAEVLGVDAGYVPADQLLVDGSRFKPVDVARPFRLESGFDLVQCLEVAEHLDPSASETLVDNLVAHAPVVLFSAAPPGQGGEHHVNERSYEFWRGLFKRRGYACFDFVRPRIRLDGRVEPWYRYNLLLFVREDAVAQLDREVAASCVGPRARVADPSPLPWRLRKLVVRLLPASCVDWLASLKHRVVLRGQAGTP
jgi:SAM-dependent methyltransferase